MEGIKAILHIGAQHSWLLNQFDVKTAFLYGDLDEEIYMRQPKGYKEPGKESHLAKLAKGLYGLKQGGWQWNKKLHKAMTKFGYGQVSVDHCIYTQTTKDGTSIVAIYVDDMVACASSKQEMKRLRKDLESTFKIKDLGGVHWVLGIAVTCDRGMRTIALSQATYIDAMIKRYKMEDAYPAPTPLEPGIRLSKSMCLTTQEARDEMSAKPYQMVVGSLMYATITTRPDISFAVQQLSQFSSNPGLQHWEATKRVLCYIKGTRDHSLILGSKGLIQLTGYSDSDWANDPDQRCSISGYIFALGGGAISWSCKKQQTVAASSCKVDYMAAGHCTKEALWLRNMLSGLGIPSTDPTTLYCDNQV